MADIDVPVSLSAPLEVNIELASPVSAPIELAGDVVLNIDVIAVGPKGRDGTPGLDGTDGVDGVTDHTLLTNIGTNTHAQIDTALTASASHIANSSNPHSVTKAQVGLGSVDNTSDASKPVSTATQTALNAKEGTITAGTTAQYYRGDKSFQTLDKTAVGLANVDNTSDATKNAASASLTNKNLNSGTNTFPTFNQNTTGSAATLTTARTIGTLTGDVTTAGSSFNGSANNSNATTLATVNSNVGSFGSATQVATFTVDGKGRTTAAGNTSIQVAESQVTNLVADLAAKKTDSMTTGRLLGRSTAGTGAIEEITLGTNLSFTGTTLNAAGGGGGGGATNLSASLSATDTIIVSDTGTDATIPAVDATNAGVMTPTQKTKLDGIASGATANTGDMVLASAQTNTGIKTFNSGTLLMRDAGNTFSAEPYSDANPPFTLNLSDQASAPANPPTGQATLYTTDGTNLNLRDNAGTTITAADLSSAQTITGAKTFNSTMLKLAGSTSGTTTLNATAAAGTTTATFPATTGTVYVSSGTDVSVADGGTGRSTSTTAYGIIAAGTTATGAQQTIAPGTSGQFLKSGGASALGAFATLSSADLSDIATLVTLTGAQTLTNKTLTTPRIAQINDANGNASIVNTATASAVNQVTITNGAAGTAPTIAASGSDADVSLNLSTKGAGVVGVSSSNGFAITGSSGAPTTPSASVGKIAMAGTSAVRPRFINSGGTLETLQTSHSSYNPYKFRARRTGAQNTGNGAFSIVNFETEDFDSNSNFDTATNIGRYTAPVAGFYQFNWYINVTGSLTILISSLFKNGVEYSRGSDIRVSVAAPAGSSGGDMIQLAAGDYVDVRAFGSSAVAIDTARNYFSGYLTTTS